MIGREASWASSSSMDETVFDASVPIARRQISDPTCVDGYTVLAMHAEAEEKVQSMLGVKANTARLLLSRSL